MYNVKDALGNGKNGLHYGPRILLPFVCDILKAVIDDDIIMDFSHVSKGAYYVKHDKFTEIYFLKHENILEDVSKYETIKMVVVDDEDDMFSIDNHIKISLNPLENHKLEISKLDDDVIFIE